MYTVRIFMKCTHVCAALLYQIIIEPDFPYLADEIAEPRPDMNIKVAAFTVSEKSINRQHTRVWYLSHCRATRLRRVCANARTRRSLCYPNTFSMAAYKDPDQILELYTCWICKHVRLKEALAHNYVMSNDSLVFWLICE